MDLGMELRGQSLHEIASRLINDQGFTVSYEAQAVLRDTIEHGEREIRRTPGRSADLAGIRLALLILSAAVIDDDLAMQITRPRSPPVSEPVGSRSTWPGSLLDQQLLALVRRAIRDGRVHPIDEPDLRLVRDKLCPGFWPFC